MKPLFSALTEQLSELDMFRYIDMDKGQLDRPALRPALAFPCALVKQSFTFEEWGNGVKNRSATVRIRIAFDIPADRTSTAAPDEARAASLSYIDKAEQVFNAFRYFETEDYEPFEAVEFLQEDRSDGLVVMRISYRTNRLDEE